MINITFYGEGLTLGFEISGHSLYEESGKDIVCSAISSAAYMTVNTITEILKINPEDLTVREGEMFLRLNEEDAIKAKDILKGFKLHVKELSKEYNEFISVTDYKE